MKTKLIVYASIFVMLFSVSAGVKTAEALLVDPSEFISFGLDPMGDSSFDTIDHIVYRTDTALALGFNPFGATPYDITFILQGEMGSFSNNGLSVFNEVTSGDAQMTFVTKFTETVTNIAFPVISGEQHTVASFASGEDTAALLRIYADDPRAPADPNGVSGYTAGAVTLTAHIFDQSASFDFNNDVGTGTGSFEVVFKLDSYDPTYWDLPPELTYLRFYSTGTLNQPNLYTPSVMWDGTPTSGALVDPFNPQLFRFDGSSDLYVVPEPSTFILMAFGLVGLGFLARKKRS